jgi:hypothetical protein
VVELIYLILNLKFNIGVVFMINYFLSSGQMWQIATILVSGELLDGSKR